MRSLFSAVLAGGLIFLDLTQGFSADDRVQPPEPSLEPAVFTSSGTWRRPPEVKWVMLFGCGGGGGGGPSQVVGMHGMTRGGTGGAASRLFTMLAGPLSATAYEVKIGQSKPYAAGEATMFGVGAPPPSYMFPGGNPGRLGDGREAGDGEASAFGKGGKGGTSARPNGEAPQAMCAGGGGAGLEWPQPPGKAGPGGGGYLVVLPLPDTARLARLVVSLEALAAGGSAPPQETNTPPREINTNPNLPPKE